MGTKRKITKEQLLLLKKIKDKELLFSIFDGIFLIEEVRTWRNTSKEFNQEYLKAVGLTDDQLNFYCPILENEHLVTDTSSFGRNNEKLHLPILKSIENELSNGQIDLILLTQ